jgi:hypothetical protein
MAMALDEQQTENDYVQQTNGITYMVEKSLYNISEPFEISFHPYGFRIDCAVKPEGCGGCNCSNK